jgi:hypothetical protein
MVDSAEKPGRRRLRVVLCLALAAVAWLPALHLLYPANAQVLVHGKEVTPLAAQLAARQLSLWENPALRQREIARMRRSNAEWDFMGRTFLVLALSNMALREASFSSRAVAVIDRIVEETTALEQKHGFYYFSMPYAKSAPYVDLPARSQFVDSEILLMMMARRFVRERPEWKPLVVARAQEMVRRMEQSPVLSAESYPDECWTFDNALALAGLRLHDALDGTDHGALTREWLARARTELVDDRTGILISEYTHAGAHQDGPEGSSIWAVVHALSLVDEPFAREQYGRARKELRRSVLGFDLAREWPASARGHVDIDSGPVIPLLDASPASSGLAFVAARAFGDEAFYAGLLRSLQFAAFPVQEGDALHFAASNAVGDSVLLYSEVLGPLWDEAKRRSRS